MNNSKINLTACVSFLSKVTFEKSFVAGQTGNDRFKKYTNGMPMIKSIEVTQSPKARIETKAQTMTINPRTGLAEFTTFATTQRTDVNNLVGMYYPREPFAEQLANNFHFYYDEKGEIVRSNARVKMVKKGDQVVPMVHTLDLSENPHGLIPCYKDFYVREDGTITYGSNNDGLNNAIVVTDSNGNVIPKLYQGYPLYNIFVSNHLKEGSKYLRLAQAAVNSHLEMDIYNAMVKYNESAPAHAQIKLRHPMQDDISKFYERMDNVMHADEFLGNLPTLTVAQLKALWLHEDLNISPLLAQESSKLNNKQKLIEKFQWLFDNDVVSKDSFRINASVLKNL